MENENNLETKEIETGDSEKEESELSASFKDDQAQKACKKIKACIDFKEPRMKQIREIEDTLAYKLKPALKGRLNVPFDSVILNGFLETLLSQNNKFPTVKFLDPKGSNYMSVKKTQSFFDQDTGSTKGKWAKKDRWSKRLAAISNIAIFEFHAESDPEYKSHLNVIDHYDFIFEPNGGGNLEEHMYCGHTNIFKTESDLSNPLYDAKQVAKLKAATSNKDFKVNEDLYRNKIERFNGLGLDVESNNYVGEQLYNLTQLEMTVNGERYYVLLDYKTGIWLRFERLEDVFESNLYSYSFWNATENAFTPMAPGPMDMIAVIAEAIRLNLNEVLNNNRKRNWDMKAVDTNLFKDLSQLDWKQDGVIGANVPINQSIQNGIYRFETPEIAGALNLNTYLNNFVGINSGITDQTKGQSSQDTLGIANLDSLNMSKRMKLIGDSYAECLGDMVYRWDWGIYEHLPVDTAVKVVGKDGVEMESISKEDLEPEWDIKIITSSDEINERKMDLERKNASLARIAADPLLAQKINKTWQLEQELKIAGWSDEDIKVAMSTEDKSDEMVSKANNAIEKILLGKTPDDVPDATPGFLTVIDDYIKKHKLDLPEMIIKDLNDYFDRQAEYAKFNAVRFASTGINPGEKMPQETPIIPTTPTPAPLSAPIMK